MRRRSPNPVRRPLCPEQLPFSAQAFPIFHSFLRRAATAAAFRSYVGDFRSLLGQAGQPASRKAQTARVTRFCKERRLVFYNDQQRLIISYFLSPGRESASDPIGSYCVSAILDIFSENRAALEDDSLAITKRRPNGTEHRSDDFAKLSHP